MSSEVAPIVKLIGKSQKGKNRVFEQGEEWHLVTVVDKVLFTTEPGPWMLLTSVKSHDKGIRWVHASNDKDFEVIR